MSDKETDEIEGWIKDKTGEAVEEIMAKGLVGKGLVEGRAVWALPQHYVIGQARMMGDHDSFFWFIAGAIPTDIIEGSQAASPRDAARHFCMKWQVFAERLGNADDRETLGLAHMTDWEPRAAAIVAQSEALYSITEIDDHWRG